jgi:hypothetical protein
LNVLATSFNRQGYLKVAKGLNIPDKSAQGYISKFHQEMIVERKSHEYYEKI